MKRDEEDSTNILKSFLKGTSVVFIGLFLSNFLNYVTRILLGRYLGPESYGVLTLSLAIFGIFSTIAVLGLDSGITRYVAFFKGKKDEERVKGTITSSLKFALPLSFIFSAIIFLLSEYISISVFSEPRLIPMLHIFAISIPFNVLFILFTASLRGIQKANYKVYSSDIFYPLTKIIIVIALLYAGYGIIGAALAWVISIIGVTILSGYFLEKSFPLIRTKITSIPMKRTLLAFSLPLLFSNMLKLVLGWTDVIFLGILKTTFDVGVYGVVLVTTDIMKIVSTASVFLFMPIIADLKSRNKNNEINTIYKTATRWTLILTLPIFIILLLYPDFVLATLFGSEYVTGALPLSILTVGTFSVIISGFSGGMMISWGKTKFYFIVDTIKGLGNLFLNILLIPQYGMFGAAVAMATAQIAGSVICILYVYKFSGMQPYSRIISKPIFTGILATLILFSLMSFLDSSGFIIKSGIIVLFILIYFTLLLIAKPFSKEDVNILKTVENKFGIKIPFRNNIKKIITRN